MMFDLACQLILDKPQNRNDIFYRLYSWDANGGPLSSRIIDVMIIKLNERFARLGMHINRMPSCTGRLYWMALDKLPEMISDVCQQQVHHEMRM